MGNVFGVGMDIVEVVRIEQSLERHGERFLKRVFLEGEVEYANTHAKPAIFLAARFSAKEAVSKAFGTGIGGHIGWKDIEVKKKESGEPYLVLHGKGRAFADELGITGMFLSLTHTEHYAGATAVLVTG